MRFCSFCSVSCIAVCGAGRRAPGRQGEHGEFQPGYSLILSGGYAQLSNDPDRYALPGFMLGAETDQDAWTVTG